MPPSAALVPDTVVASPPLPPLPPPSPPSPPVPPVAVPPVTVEVVVPSSLTPEAREALDNYSHAIGAQNPRAKLFAAGS